MQTTIQISDKTLLLLKKLKEETNSKSYEETINRIAIERANKKSMGGILGKKYGKVSVKEILKELKEERRKSDRF
jgi:predicted CopG family antitoxin